MEAKRKLNKMEINGRVKLIWVSNKNPLGLTPVRSLDRGLSYYQTTGNFKDLISTVDKIKFIPLTLRLTIEEKNFNSQWIEELKVTIKHLVTTHTFSRVDLVSHQVEKFNNIYVVVFTPTYKGDAVFLSKNNNQKVTTSIDLLEYYGYYYLTNNPLGYFILNKYQNEYQTIVLKDINQTGNLFFLKTNEPEIVLEIRSMILNYIELGYFAFAESLTTHKENTLNLVSTEIAWLWNIKLISSNEPLVYKSKNKNKEWLHINTERVIDGLIPKDTVYLKKVLYTKKAVVDSFERLIKLDPILKKYKSEFAVYDSGIYYIVTAAFGTLRNVNRYKSLLNGNKIKARLVPKIKSGKFVFEPSEKGRISQNRQVFQIHQVSLLIDITNFIDVREYDINFTDHYNVNIKSSERLLPYKTLMKKDKNYLNEINKKWISGVLLTDWSALMLTEVGKISHISIKNE